MKKTQNKKQWNSLSVDEQARWLCLLEAVNQITTFAEKAGINTDKSSKWIKNGAMNRYINETFPSMKLRLQHDAEDDIDQ